MSISDNSLYYTQPKADETKPEFWYETTFTLPGGAAPKQLHATIIDNNFHDDIGTIVVIIFKFEEDGKLTMGVVEDFEEPPPSSIVGDWEWVRDIYYLERAQPPEPARR